MAPIAGLWLGELPVLRSIEPATLSGARESASYPLVPYSNRLGYRRFRWRGRTYTTAPNWPPTSRTRCTAWAGAARGT